MRHAIEVMNLAAIEKQTVDEKEPSFFMKPYWKEVLQEAILNQHVVLANRLMQIGVLLEESHFKYLVECELVTIDDDIKDNELLLKAVKHYFQRSGAIRDFISRPFERDYTKPGYSWALRVSTKKSNGASVLLYIAIQSYLDEQTSYQEKTASFRCIQLLLSQEAARVFKYNDALMLRAIGNYIVNRKKGFFVAGSIPKEREKQLRDIWDIIHICVNDSESSEVEQRNDWFESMLRELKTGFIWSTGHSLLKKEIESALVCEKQRIVLNTISLKAL